jgi:cytochrome b561
MSAVTSQPANYDPVLKTIHWLTLAMIAGVFAAAWIAHSGLAGEWFRAVLDIHRSLGLSLMGLTVFRLAWRRCAAIPKLPADLHPLQKLAARTTEALLYVLLLVQPVVGLLQTNARGQQVDFFFAGHLPAVIGADRGLVRLLHDLHALTAKALLIVIGMHAAAALFHHFIRRDDVLNAMLPKRLRGIGRSLFALRPPTEQS